MKYGLMPLADNPAEVARLHKVFGLVENKDNWKLPIDATVLAGLATEAEIRKAVIFFTGSVPTIEPTTMYARPHSDALVSIEFPALRVTAAGYYAVIGS